MNDKTKKIVKEEIEKIENKDEDSSITLIEGCEKIKKILNKKFVPYNYIKINYEEKNIYFSYNFITYSSEEDNHETGYYSEDRITVKLKNNKFVVSF